MKEFAGTHHFNPAKADIQCPIWEGEVPEESLVMVYYTVTAGMNNNTKVHELLNYNLVAVAVLALSKDHCHPAEYYYDPRSDSEDNMKNVKGKGKQSEFNFWFEVRDNIDYISIESENVAGPSKPRRQRARVASDNDD